MFIITNKPGGNKKIWSIKDGRFVVEFDKDNKAVIESKTLADKLRKLGYIVEKDGDDAQNDGDEK